MKVILIMRIIDLSLQSSIYHSTRIRILNVKLVHIYFIPGVSRVIGISYQRA